MKLDLRRIPIHRPYPDEVPWELLPESIADSLDLNRMRVAKLKGAVAGVYAFEQAAALRYNILALAVAPSHRKKGLGRWLLGHAIGVCETKGAREIIVPCLEHSSGPALADREGALPFAVRGAAPNGAAAHRLFSRAGFAKLEAGYRLLLTPD